ncbi:MAG: universal stress protein [Verrucomicrobiota bacterium]
MALDMQDEREYQPKIFMKKQALQTPPSQKTTSPRRLSLPKIQKILTTTDFSKESFYGLRYAAFVAEKWNSKIDLLHVEEPSLRQQIPVPLAPSGMDPLFGFPQLYPLPLPSFRPKKNDQFLSALRIVADREFKKISTRTSVRHGKAFHEINEQASKTKADLIIMSTHGYTGIKHLWLGSVTERVIRHSQCPVLSIPISKSKRTSFKLRKVLVPIDFSKASLKAIPYAIAIAKKWNSEVVLLSIVESTVASFEMGYPPASISLDPTAPLENHLKELQRLQKKYFSVDLSVKTIATLGSPIQQINETSKTIGADLIILTTHGYTGLKHVLLGSTAEYVLRNSHLPVLTIPVRGNS